MHLFSYSFWTMWVQYGEPPKLLNLLSAPFRQRHDRLRSKFRSEIAMSSRGTRSESGKATYYLS